MGFANKTFANKTSANGWVNALAAIVQGGRSLAYSLGNYDALWHQTYPGYGGYAPTGYYNRYQIWAQTTLDTVVGAMRAYPVRLPLAGGVGPFTTEPSTRVKPFPMPTGKPRI